MSPDTMPKVENMTEIYTSSPGKDIAYLDSRDVIAQMRWLREEILNLYENKGTSTSGLDQIGLKKIAALRLMQIAGQIERQYPEV